MKMRDLFSRVLGILVFCALSTMTLASCGGDSSAPPSPTVSSTTATGKIYTTGTVSVTFSTVMDTASVESGFQITGSGPVTGTLSWSDNTVTFTPGELWKTNHLYTLTIAKTTKDDKGTEMAAPFTQTFKPILNMHDVNNDGIGDFLLGSPFNATNGAESGLAYLFFGKKTWSNIALASQKADVTYGVQAANAFFGLDIKVVGDVNGDGYADIAISAPYVGINSIEKRGFVILLFGSPTMSDITFNLGNLNLANGLFLGPDADTYLGFSIIPVGDVNGDGLADFLIGGRLVPNDSRFWLILGRKTPFPDPTTMPSVADSAAANYIVEGDMAISGFPAAGCDVNKDELSDIILGASQANAGGTKRGKVFVISGTGALADRDLRTQTADETIIGAADNDSIGVSLSCGDVNNDGFGDIIIGAPTINSSTGRAYIIAGASTFKDYNLATDAPLTTINGAAAADYTGLCTCIPGDINKDGFNDFFIGAPMKAVDGIIYQGMAYLFSGSASPANIDLATQSANVTYTGPTPAPGKPSLLGFCQVVGDVNGDGTEDMLIGAPAAAGGGLIRGEAYLVFGSSTLVNLNFTTESPDALITGAADNDTLMVTSTAL